MNEKRNYGALVLGVALICMGGLALFERLFEGTRFWGMLWPFIIIGFGALFFVGMFLLGKPFAWMAIPGSIIATNGLMLFLQNLTGRWETWSYSWTVIIMSIGAGIYIMGAWQGDASRRKAGVKLFEVGAVLFVIFGAFFEIIFALGAPEGLRGYVFPIALLFLGIYLIVKRSGIIPQSKNGGDQPVVIENPEIK